MSNFIAVTILHHILFKCHLTAAINSPSHHDAASYDKVSSNKKPLNVCHRCNEDGFSDDKMFFELQNFGEACRDLKVNVRFWDQFGKINLYKEK